MKERKEGRGETCNCFHFISLAGPEKRERKRGQTAAGGRWDGKLKEELEGGREVKGHFWHQLRPRSLLTGGQRLSRWRWWKEKGDERDGGKRRRMMRHSQKIFFQRVNRNVSEKVFSGRNEMMASGKTLKLNTR